MHVIHVYLLIILTINNVPILKLLFPFTWFKWADDIILCVYYFICLSIIK